MGDATDLDGVTKEDYDPKPIPKGSVRVVCPNGNSITGMVMDDDGKTIGRVQKATVVLDVDHPVAKATLEILLPTMDVTAYPEYVPAESTQEMLGKMLGSEEGLKVLRGLFLWYGFDIVRVDNPQKNSE